ncbi:MAG: substrate-binding domain-containing protein [Oscillospiraceae bacterium]
MIERPLIGIITAKVATSEQKQILSGIMEQAHHLGMDTAIFSNIDCFEKYYAGGEVENRIYDLITSERLSGLILNAESILNPDLQQYIYERIIKRNVPVVVTGAELEGMVCINNNVVSDFEDIARHLIEAHHFTEIDVLTGWKGVETSHQRVQGCRNALQAHGFDLPEDNIIYGDFWMTSGENLAMEYIEGKRRIPQAVICANDYMAYGICDKFLEHGIPIPQTMTVIGYEYIGRRFEHSPILTTYLRNRYTVGKMAVNRLYSLLNGKKTEEIPIHGQLILGGTCSCGIGLHQLHEELQQVRQVQKYIDFNFESNFAQQLTTCRSMGDYIHVLQEFAYLVREVKGIWLCLYEDWCTAIDDSAHTGDSIMLCYRAISPTKGTDAPQLFQRNALFPETLAGAVNQNFLYFAPVFFAGRELGHFILQYDKPDGYDAIFSSWLKIATNALESLRMKNDLCTLLQCQNLSDKRDTVTGLLNEAGFIHELQFALGKASKGQSCMIILIRTAIFSDDTSLDERKNLIHNDREIAKILKQISDSIHGVCARLKERLFAVATIGNFSELQLQQITDYLCTKIQYIPSYQETIGINSIVAEPLFIPVTTTDLEQNILSLISKIREKIQILSVKRTQPNFEEFNSIRQEIFKNPQQEWNAHEICQKVHLSYGHFCALYKKLFGASFHQDVIFLRISYAKYLLLTTAYNPSVIAFDCGYADEKYFFRQFHRVTGMTPSNFRNTAHNLL